MDKTYTFDISLTNDCNFQCVYCIERGYFTPKYLSLENTKIILDKIIKLYNSQYFKSIGIEKLKFSFWGGEPTLNLTVIEYIISYMEQNNIPSEYSIFTNGYLLTPTLLDYIEKINEKTIFDVQISYDGGILQKLCRKALLINDTSIEIKNKIKDISKRKIPFHLKSTVSFQYFKYLYDAYNDIYEFSKEIGRTLNFSLTLDYSPQTLNFLDEKKLIQYKKDLELNLLQIAKKEKEFLVKDEDNIFTWFKPTDINRSMCGAGHHYYSIDILGNILTCHGCEYSDKKEDHILCNMLTDDIIHIEQKLQQRDIEFIDIFNPINECKECDALICYRCNAIKYELSQKETYKEKWLDYKTQPILCDIYKMISNIYRVLLLQVKKDIYELKKV